VYRQIWPIYFRIAFSELDAFCKFCPLDKILGEGEFQSSGGALKLIQVTFTRSQLTIHSRAGAELASIIAG
jgi:hypothetical protein